jgi:enoyl-CoA hydratase/carnithine racemase
MPDILQDTDETYADGKILLSISDGIGLITFNHPEKRNAMSLDMWQGLVSALVELRDDPDVRVVIMAGAGDRAFVSGADVSQFEKIPPQRQGVGRILATQGRTGRGIDGVSETDHRMHPGLLPRRRIAGRDAGGYPNCRREQ